MKFSRYFLLLLAAVGLSSAHATERKPLVLNATGQVQQLPAGDTISPTIIVPGSASNSQVIRSITSAPTYTFPEALSTEFQGDFSGTILPWKMTVTGTATAGQPTTGYKWSPALSGFPSHYVFSSGWNQATNSNDGRTGVAAYRTMVQQNGNGDAGAYYGNCSIGGSGKAGATHWLAQPACVILNGDLSTSLDHSYLNQFEFNLTDNGHDISAIGTVENFYRTNNTASQGEVWFGDRFQSNGTKAINAGWSATGLVNVGLDTVTATADSTWNGGKTVVVNMAADQRIIFNSTATAMNGISWYGNNPGNAYDTYSSGSGYLSRCNNGGCLNVNTSNLFFTNNVTSGSVLIEAVNSNTGSSATAQLIAVHGAGNSVTVTAASSYSLINSATQSMGFAVGGTPYFSLGTDGVLRGTNGGALQLTAVASSGLPGCNSGNEGRLYAVTDANSTTFNATLVGGGSNHVMAFCNGTSWTIH